MHSIEAFKTKGVVKIAGALDLEFCRMLSNYVCLKAKNAKRSGAYREYADPMMETLLLQLQSKVEAATGLELWPTLSFCYHYTHGDVLPRHKDRSSCEIVAGLCIGADEEFYSNNKTWDLQIKGIDPIKLNYGDLLIFRGKDMEHWRDKFTGDWFVSAIFGYVDKNGSFAFQKFDQRTALGTKHIGMTAWCFGVLKASLRNYFSQTRTLNNETKNI